MGKGSRHASHQQKARDFGRRSPGADAALGLIVEEPFSYERSPMVAAERRRAVIPAWVPEQATTQGTGYAPAEKLPSKSGPRFMVTRMAG
jgi:hypothetical protein